MIPGVYKKQRKYLETYPVLIEDTSSLSSEYFNIQVIPSTLTSGKNLIIILGKRNRLLPNTNVYIEILDINNEPIYYEVPNIKGQNNSRYIIPYIFSTTPIGSGRITLVGTAKYDLSNKKIIGKWSTIPNVRWSRPIFIDRNTRNESEILFNSIPLISIDRINSEYYTLTQPSNVTFTSGSVSYEISNHLPNILSTGFEFNSDMLNASISVPSPNIGSIEYPAYTSVITEIVSGKRVVVNDFYDYSSYFDPSSYEIVYTPSTERTISTLNSKYYIKLGISNINLLSGDVYRSKLYFRDKNYDSHYELLDDFVYENKSLLYDYTDINNVVDFGGFTSESILSYWDVEYENNEYSSTFITKSLNNDYFLDSMLLESTYKNNNLYFLCKQNTAISYKNSLNYILSFNLYVGDFSNVDLIVYVSGSSFVSDNILGIKMFQKTLREGTNNDLTCNITPNSDGTGCIVFKLQSGKNWYLNDIKLYPKIDTIHSPQSYTKFIATPFDHLSSSMDFRLDYFNYQSTQAIESSYAEMGDAVTYTSPTLELTLDVVNESGITFEIGTIINVELTSSFTKNDAGSVSSRNIKRSNTTLSTELTQDIVTYLDTNVEVISSIQYSTTVNYEEGSIKNNAIGEPFPYGHIEAGSLTDYAYIYGKYKAIYGVSSSYQESNLNDNSWVRNSSNYQNMTFLNPTSGATTTFNINVSDQDIFTWIIVPSDYTVSSIKLLQSSYAEILASFDSTLVTIQDGGSNSLECLAYYEKLVIPNSQNVTYIVTVTKNEI